MNVNDNSLQRMAVFFQKPLQLLLHQFWVMKKNFFENIDRRVYKEKFLIVASSRERGLTHR